MSTLDTLTSKIEKLNSEIKASFKDAMREEAETIFKKYPDLESFAWTQYTPYFNDGDPCEFTIHGVEDVVYRGEDVGEYGGLRLYDWKTKQLTEDGKRFFSSYEEYNQFLHDCESLPNKLQAFEGTVRSVLGEGKVIVSREGVEVEDYDHD